MAHMGACCFLVSFTRWFKGKLLETGDPHDFALSYFDTYPQSFRAQPGELWLVTMSHYMILWMDEILLKPRETTCLLVIIISGLLGWCRISSIRSGDHWGPRNSTKRRGKLGAILRVASVPVPRFRIKLHRCGRVAQTQA